MRGRMRIVRGRAGERGRMRIVRGRTGARVGFLIALVLGGVAARPAGAGPRLDMPRFEYARFGFAADAMDATAIFLNPAGLSGGPGTNLYADISGSTDGIVEYVAALQGKGMGFAYRHREPQDAAGLPPGELSVTDPGHLDTYMLAGGYGPPKLRVGLSAAWNKTDMAGEDAFSWTAGFQSFLSESYAIGVTLENILNPAFLDGELRPRYTYGLAVHAVPGLLTLNIQGSHQDGDADLIRILYGARVTIPAGWTFSAVLDDPPGSGPTFGLSVTWLFGKGAASARGRSLDRNKEFRGQAALQIFDQFWQQSTQKAKPPQLPAPRRR